jgi:hypothetical protein
MAAVQTAYLVSRLLHKVSGIHHGHSFASEGQHFEVVVAVSEGNHLRRVKKRAF